MQERILTENMLAAFHAYLAGEEKSKNTIDKYLRDARALAAYQNGAPVTKQAMISYKQKLLAEGYTVRSINSMLASVNSLFSFLGWPDCRLKCLKCQRQMYCTAENELTKEEYLRLVEAACRKGDQRLSLILQTICGTGIRVSELQYVTVEAVRTGAATVFLKGKIRTVFFVRALRKRLLRYAAERHISRGAIFITRTGKPVDRTNVWREMKKSARKRASLRKRCFRTIYGICSPALFTA